MHSAEHAFTGWHKSSYSGANQGECLEVARGHATVPDNKTLNGPVLVLSACGWTAFVTAVKDGSLDA
ncbi:DUF397 domain-containing protein [Streptomyces sp. NPDC001455]|uniref:DUF397 domain-containing protein n=1 Tax=unclassified Streptomyces TaxID=2593676 RepID=UPI003329FB1F